MSYEPVHARRPRRWSTRQVVMMLAVTAAVSMAIAGTTGALAAELAAPGTSCSGGVPDGNGDFSLSCHITPVSPSGSPTPPVSPTPTATATPTPSPTTAPPTPPPTTQPPTPTPAVVPPTPTPGSCLPSPSACGFPDASNTGVPAGTVLTASSGDFTVKNNGAVINGMDITGCVSIAASNVTIENSRIRCAGAYGIHNDDRNSATGLVIRNVEVDCANTGGSTAIAGHNFAAVADNLHGCENGLAMDGNTSVVASWIHGLALVGAGHTDGIQSGGKGVLIQGNTIVNDTAGGTSTIITDPTTTANFTISGNLLSNDGGSYLLYCSKTPTTFVVTGNRLAWAHDYGYDYNGQCGASWVTWSGNVADATGAALGP
jgi:hypothetical protein